MARMIRHERRRRFWTILAIVALAAGNASGKSWPEATYYTVIVRPGDTVRSLAARYRVPVVQVAQLNQVDASEKLRAGKVLRIPAFEPATREAVLGEAMDSRLVNYAPPPRNFASHAVADSRDVSEPEIVSREHFVSIGRAATAPRFEWPVSGSIISKFGMHGAGQRNDGINIAAGLGEPVHAAASGTVTYAGDGLKGYGNLILIAHDGGYVTAYAHVDTIGVAPGDRVRQGQVIGTAGETGGVDQPQLHFEIRHHVKPLDPGTLLVASR